jgi:hypothetical protein
VNGHVNDLGFIPCLKLLRDFSDLLLDIRDFNLTQLMQGGLIDRRVKSRVNLRPYSCVVMLDC